MGGMDYEMDDVEDAFLEATRARVYAFLDHMTQITFPRLPPYVFGSFEMQPVWFSAEFFDADGMYGYSDDEDDDESPRPLARDAWDSLSRLPASEQQADACILCDGEMNGVWVRLSPCGHTLHETCVDAWLRSHDTCPCCTVAIRISSHVQEV